MQPPAANIPEVLHRVAAMASGGMDTHNGAVITLLAVTGLTHREDKDILVSRSSRPCGVRGDRHFTPPALCEVFMTTLDGKTALVTGSTSGIGRDAQP